MQLTTEGDAYTVDSHCFWLSYRLQRTGLGSGNM